jgi:NAD(P)-dependent dehydrogenase (short-subunit alcohol dehydrogenase family)
MEGRVVVVTGGAGAIGSEFVRGIAAEGGVAVAADANLEAAMAVAEGAAASGRGRVEPERLDITSPGSVNELIGRLHERHGRIDAVVNSAYPRNRAYGRRLEEVDIEDFNDNVGMHLGGYFLVAQRFCLYFRERGGGAIVNMSSIYGSMTPRFRLYEGTSMTMPVEYAAIKSAVEHLTRYLAQYFKADGIRVNSLSPGGILAGQPESFLAAYRSHCGTKGMLSAADVLGTLLFLLSDDARYVTGQNIVVDDGFSL